MAWRVFLSGEKFTQQSSVTLLNELCFVLSTIVELPQPFSYCPLVKLVNNGSPTDRKIAGEKF